MAVRRVVFLPLLVLVVACTLVARSPHPMVSHAKAIVPREEMRPRYPSPGCKRVTAIGEVIEPWRADATLQEIARHWRGIGARGIDLVEEELVAPEKARAADFRLAVKKSAFQLYDGDAVGSYETSLASSGR